MTPIRMIVAAELRRRASSIALAALLVALVTAVVLATAAGARRTASTLDRLLADTDAGDTQVAVWGADVTGALVSDLSAIPGVVRVGVAHAFPVAVATERDFSLVSSPQDSMFREIDRPLVLEGRLPAPDAPDEVALNEIAAAQLGLEIGDRLAGPMGAPDLYQTLIDDGVFPGFNGPRVDLEVVGIVRLPQDLQRNVDEADPLGLASSAFDREHAGAAAASTIATVVTVDSSSLDRIRGVAQQLSQGAMGFDVGDTGAIYRDVQAAIDVLATGLAVFALVAAIAGVLAVGQAISRQIGTGTGTDAATTALGMTAGQRTWVNAGPAIAGSAIGIVTGTIIAAACSPLFPLSVARRAEPQPGLTIDGRLLAGGALLAVASCVGWSLFSGWRVTRSVRPGTGRGTARAASPSIGPPVVEIAVSRALRPPARQGTARSPLLGIGLAIAGMTGVLVVAATLHDALETPQRWGWTWSTRPDALDPSALDRQLDAIGREPGIEATGFLLRNQVVLDDVPMTGYALAARSGSLALAVAEGRLPVSANEVALGGQEMDTLRVAIGDTVRAVGTDGDALDLTVVGRVALPTIDNTSPGEGAAFNDAGLRRVSGDAEQTLVLRYSADADVVGLERRLQDEYGLVSDSVYAHPRPPARLANLDQLVGLLPAMALFFAVIGIVGLLHVLVMSSRSGRREVGVLSALGMANRQLRHIVVCQSLVVVLAGAACGMTLGVIIGRVVWRLSVADIGMLGGPSTPWAQLGIVLVTAIAAAVVLAWPIGAWFSAGRPARVLRTE